MNRSLHFVCLTLAACLFFSAATLCVFARPAPYTKRDVTAYVYSLDRTDTVKCLFTPALPEEPYIDAFDFLRLIYVVDFEVSVRNGVVSVTSDNGTMICDAANDTVRFDDFYSFAFFDADLEGTMLECDYVEYVDEIRSSDDVAVTLDLGAYGFDIIADGGRVYFPISLISSIFIDSYNAAVYAYGNVYFVHALENENYFALGDFYDDTERSATMADFTYRTLCFTFDTFYGAPSSARLAASIAAKGFDRALAEYDATTKLARDLLRSTDMLDYFCGLLALYPYLDDGGHTFVIYEPFIVMDSFPGSPIAVGLDEILSAEKPASARDRAAAAGAEYYDSSYDADGAIFDAWNASSIDFVNSWNGDRQMLYRDGDTAMFSFESFENEVLEPFGWSLDWAKRNGIRNFVLDLTTNGGGSTAVLDYLLAVMTAARTGSNEIRTTTVETLTGVRYTAISRVDLDLNGVIDWRDADFCCDFDFAILTSHMSFSCANSLAMIARERGIAVLGERSGGGACIITEPYVGGAHFVTMSGNLKYVVQSGADFDLGAAVDFDLTARDAGGNVDYSALFDLGRIGELVTEFYGPLRGDANGDGAINAKDVVAIMKVVVGIVPVRFDADLADCNRDGRVNARDVVAVMKAIVRAR